MNIPELDLTKLNQLLAQNATSSLLRLSTAGSVDDGKSTLIGRLLHDSKNIYDDHLDSLKKRAKSDGKGLDLALVTDGLKAEQEQGITIDVAYRYFSTPKRRFILADTPGHEQYTRNMATGSSTADLSIILIDARKGVLIQTRRHSFIASLLGVPRLLVAINKMDLVDYQQSVFDQIKAQYLEFASKLGIKDIRFVPISALNGDNIVHPSSQMPWYSGETVMQYLENVYIGADSNLVDFRFPVQYVIRPDQNYRGYAGQIRSGAIRVGEEVLVLPSMRQSRIKSIDVFSNDASNSQLSMAHAPMSVSLTLEDEIDISRGDMLVRPKNVPLVQNSFEAMLVWMTDKTLSLARPYILMHTSRETKAMIDMVDYKIDVSTLSRTKSSPLELNEIGRVSITTKNPIFFDPYSKNRATGNFILVDQESFQTVAAGMIIDRTAQSSLSTSSLSGETENLHSEIGRISKADREAKYGFKAVTLWCTGLSGSGKSTLAKAVEVRFFEQGRPVYRLDGDNLRLGLNRNLGFSEQDRTENIRRAAEVAKLFNDAGVTVICSLISPLISDRAAAREIIGADNFIEIYLSTPISVCEQRDPHGLYKKARAGEIKNFTGVSAPYEAPKQAALSIDTTKATLEQIVLEVISLDCLQGAS